MAVRVLYAEDFGELRLIGSRMMSKIGYEVIPAQNGEDALAKFRKDKKAGRSIDLVITDIDMPVINGKRLIEILRKEEKFAGEIAVASGSSVDTKFAHEYGVFCWAGYFADCIEAYKKLISEKSRGG